MTAYISQLIMAALTTIVGMVIGLLVEKYHKEKAMRSMQVNKTRAELFEHYTEVIAAGFTTPHEIEVWEPVFQDYKNGKGNGVIDRLHEEVTELPIKVR